MTRLTELTATFSHCLGLAREPRARLRHFDCCNRTSCELAGMVMQNI